MSTLALPAFLASAASTLCLQDEILFECQCQPDDPLVASYMSLWSASFGALPTGCFSYQSLSIFPLFLLPIDRQFGTDLALMPLRLSCNPPSLTLARRPRFWQPLLLTQATGSMHYPSPPAGCVWTMRQSE